MSYGRIRYDKNQKPYIILEFRRINPYTKEKVYYSKKEFLDDSLTPAKLKKQADLLDEKFCQNCQEKMKLKIANKNYTYKEFCQIYLEHLKSKKALSTHCYDEIYANVIIKELGNIKLKDISIDTVEDLYDKLSKIKYKKEVVKFKNGIDIKKILKNKKITCQNIRDEYNIDISRLDSFKKNGGTRVRAEKIANALNIPFDNLFQVDIIEKEKSYYTKKNYMSFFRASMAYAVKKKLIEKNIASSEYVDIPKNNNFSKKTKCMNKEEFLSLYKIVLNYPDIRIKNAFLLLLSTGMRKEELVGLTWENINFTNKTIDIKNTVVYIYKKGNVFNNKTKNQPSTRVIAISDELIESLKEYKKYCEEQKNKSIFLFTQRNGTVMSPVMINYWLNKLLKENNMNHYTVHSLRHTYASLMIEETPSIIAVSRRIGHSKVSTTTDIYGHVVSDLDRKIANTLLNDANKKDEKRIVSILTEFLEDGSITFDVYKKIIEKLN